MAMPEEPPHADDGFVDLCQVQRLGAEVVIVFGRRVPSVLADGAEGVAPVHRVSLGAAGAARLQDLMTALLQDEPGRRP